MVTFDILYRVDQYESNKTQSMYKSVPDVNTQPAYNPSKAQKRTGNITWLHYFHSTLSAQNADMT
jgi:hypothetical protein